MLNFDILGLPSLLSIHFVSYCIRILPISSNGIRLFFFSTHFCAAAANLHCCQPYRNQSIFIVIVIQNVRYYANHFHIRLASFISITSFFSFNLSAEKWKNKITVVWSLVVSVRNRIPLNFFEWKKVKNENSHIRFCCSNSIELNRIFRF